MLTYIKNLFEHKEENCYNQQEEVTFVVTTILKTKVTVLSIEEYLNKIRPYLKDITDDLKTSGK